ncbi:MAG: thiamine pyrophosphate-dependent dehydrogenase E1 component subunit alpha [Dehalococcoidia bacterium]
MTLSKDIEGEELSLRELGLGRPQVLEMYRDMLTARAISERMWVLGRLGKIYFLVSCEGHEAAQIGSTHAMRRGTDIFIPYYRDLGVALAVGSPPRDLVLSALGKRADPYSAGRQLPGHYGRKDLNMITGSSCVASQILHAVGTAYASRYRNEEAVTIVYFGDGATSKGDFHEALNFAGIHRLPVIFFCENNRWAISVPQDRQMAVEDLAIRAEGYGFPGVTVDGMDLLQVYRTTREAAERAREGQGPTLVEAKTYRFASHSSNDDQSRYRAKEELEQERASDPIPRFQQYLIDASLLTEAEDSEMRLEVQCTIDQAVADAEASEDPTPEDALTQVYAGEG